MCHRHARHAGMAKPDNGHGRHCPELGLWLAGPGPVLQKPCRSVGEFNLKAPSHGTSRPSGERPSMRGVDTRARLGLDSRRFGHATPAARGPPRRPSGHGDLRRIVIRATKAPSPARRAAAGRRTKDSEPVSVHVCAGPKQAGRAAGTCGPRRYAPLRRRANLGIPRPIY